MTGAAQRASGSPMAPAVASDPSLLYRGGYVLTEADHQPDPSDAELRDLLARWDCARIGRYVVRFDDTWRCSRAQVGDAEVLLLGTAMDLDAPSASQGEVVGTITAALDASDRAFLDRIDALVGAHVIVARRGTAYWALQDATAMEALCYDVGGEATLVASHPALIADIRGYQLSELGDLWRPGSRDPQAVAWKLRAGPWHLPGVTTPYEHVRALTPNTRLDLTSSKVERFFPRGPIGVEDLDSIVERVGAHLRDAFGWIAGQFPQAVSVSLSGGLDSRLTLAASRPLASQLRYFTYYYADHPVHRHDRRVARTLADRLGLEHTDWQLRSPPAAPAARRAWARTHRGIHGPGQLEFGFLHNFPAGDVHVRSNVLEVVRGYFVKNPVHRRDEFDAAKLSRLFRVATVEAFVSHYEQFIAVTDFTHERKCDMHYTDLYHWEQRLGRWHSDLVRRMKLTHNTFIVWNSRRLLTLMLARPADERAKAAVVYRLIDRLWPDVLHTPIFSGARFSGPPRDLGVGPSAFDWERLPAEVRAAFTRALGRASNGDGPAAQVTVEGLPAPDSSFFSRPETIDAALDHWLPLDPIAREQVDAVMASASPDGGEDAQSRRSLPEVGDGQTRSTLRRALAEALVAAGESVPPVPDAGALRPYLRVATSDRMNPAPLHPYEQEVVSALRDHHATRGPSLRGLVVMPAGSTRMRPVVRWLVQDIARAGTRVLWIAHCPELLAQSALAFVDTAAVLRDEQAFLRLRLAGAGFSADRAATLLTDDYDVAIATIDAIGSDLPAVRALLEREDLAVVIDDDDARYQAASASRAVAEAALTARGPVIGLVGGALRARKDAPYDPSELYGATLASVDGEELRRIGQVARPQLQRVDTLVAAGVDRGGQEGDSLSREQSSGRVASRLGLDSARNEKIIRAWMEGPPGGDYGRTLALAIDQPHAVQLALDLRAADVRAEWVSHARPDREAVWRRFARGEVDVLVVGEVLAEGVDLPKIETVLLCRPTRSATLLAEMLRPALRGPQVGGTPAPYVVWFQDRWEQLTCGLGPVDVLEAGRGEEAR